MKKQSLQRGTHIKTWNDALRIRLLAAGIEKNSDFAVIFDEEGFICWANTSFEALSGFTLAEVVGKDVKMLFSEHGNPETLLLAEKCLLHQREWRGEIISKRKDGSDTIDGVAVTPIFDEISQKTYFLVVGQDITEKIKARETLLAAMETQRKAERMFSVGAMAAGIAHEINQPLNAIKVLSDGILYLLAQGETLQIEEFAESIKEIAGQTDRIVNITKLLRSCLKQDELQTAPCSVNEAVDAALSIVGNTLDAHAVTVRKYLQKGLPPVMGVFTGLEEVVINLLVNAMQALDSVDKAKKKIVIKTYLTDYIMLEVSDNGPGIDPLVGKKIFNSFVSTKKNDNNMGLGLAIVRTIVTSFFGTIKVLSNEMGGATFVVSLPPVLESCKEGA